MDTLSETEFKTTRVVNLSSVTWLLFFPLSFYFFFNLFSFFSGRIRLLRRKQRDWEDKGKTFWIVFGKTFYFIFFITNRPDCIYSVTLTVYFQLFLNWQYWYNTIYFSFLSQVVVKLLSQILFTNLDVKYSLMLLCPFNLICLFRTPY